MEKLVLNNISRFFKGLFSARKWQRFWSKDWVLKFVSLVLATILWYFVGGEDKVDKNVMVPIEIINLPRDLVISNQFKKEIEVTVSGPRSVIQDMTNREVTRQINLSNATPGTNVIENDNDSIPVPRGITVLRIQPSSIILSLDKLIQKRFEVMPVTTGDVAAGYEAVAMRMSPDVITITGPETILSQADALLTDIIDINGMTQSRQSQVPLDLDPSFVDLIGETSVTADIIIKPRVVQKKINKVKVDAYVGGVHRGVAPATVDVLANIPVLLMRKEKDLTKLISVTAIGGENNDEFLKVSVIPKENIDLPIEIVSVIPDVVKLVRPGSEERETSQEQESAENDNAEDDDNEQQSLREKIAAQEGEEPITAEQEQTVEQVDGLLKILATKKKKIIKE